MIPPPDHACPKCGNPIPHGTSVCSVCGQGRGAGRGLVALWAVLLIVVGLPAGLLGGCLLMVASGTPTGFASSAALGLLGVALPLFFTVMLVRAGKK